MPAGRVLQVVPSLQMGGAEHVGSYLGSVFAEPGILSLCALADGPMRNWLDRRHVSYSVRENGRPRWQIVARRIFRSASALSRLIRKPNDTVEAAAVLVPVWCESSSSNCRNWFSAIANGREYDVIHLHSVWCAGLIECARAHSRRVVFGQHNVLSERHGPEDIDFLSRQLAAVDVVVCPTVASKSDFVSTTGYPPERTVVIPNPSFLAVGEKRTVDSARRVGTASNLGAAKDIGVLLDACAQVRLSGLDLELRIAGGEPEVAGHWQREAWSRGLTKASCIFLGRLITEEELNRFYDGIDMFVLPSRTEAFALVAVEALSRGIPVIASDIPALREVIHEAGLFFKPGDAKALAEILRSLISDRHALAELSQLGFQLWTRRYGRESILEAYAALYRAS